MADKKVAGEQPDLFAADVGGSRPAVPSLRPWETSYNNWTWAERCAVTPIQNAMFRSGELIRPTVCSICGFSRPDQLHGSGYIYSHLERYDRPAEIYPVCKRHHADLHARFRQPLRWQGALETHGRAGAWFTWLSMDAASQWRPFRETYPDGLPLPGEGL
jgi:hypothetical protein